MNLDAMSTAQFYMGNSDFVEKKDQDSIKSVLYKTSKYLMFTTFLGVTANIQFKKIPKVNFLNWPFYVRLPMRFILLTSPNLLFYKSHLDTSNHLEEYLHKYHKRLYYFQKTGDFCYMDPNGELYKEFKAKNTGLQ